MEDRDHRGRHNSVKQGREQMKMEQGQRIRVSTCPAGCCYRLVVGSTLIHFSEAEFEQLTREVFSAVTAVTEGERADRHHCH